MQKSIQSDAPPRFTAGPVGDPEPQRERLHECCCCFFLSGGAGEEKQQLCFTGNSAWLSPFHVEAIRSIMKRPGQDWEFLDRMTHAGQ